MCGRFALFNPDAIYSRYRVWAPDDFFEKEIRPRYNIAPSQHVPVIYQDKGGENKLEIMRWGLVPSWAKDPRIGAKLINARAETVAVKPAFKHSLRSRRCVVPGTGFFEWKRTGRDKIPYYIALEGDELFAFAGLYDSWKDAEGKELKTFTIITTTPNNVLRPIHDRMPVILQRAFEDPWLDAAAHDSNSLVQMLKPFPDDKLKAHIVSKELNNPANDNPRIIRAVRGNLNV